MSGEEKKGAGVWDQRVKRRTAVALAALFATLLLCYFALCAAAGSGGKLLPRTALAGVDVGGLTQEEAVRTLNGAVSARLAGLQVEFLCEGRAYTVPGTDFAFDAAQAVRQMAGAQAVPFPARGLRLLGALLGRERYEGTVFLNGTPAAVLEAAALTDDPDLATTWTVEGDELVFTKGRSGRMLDRGPLFAALEARMTGLLNGTVGEEPPVTARIAEGNPPAEPDFTAICQEVRTQVQDAHVDPVSRQVVPAVVGRELDPEKARTALARTAEGETCRLPLTLTQPELTTEALNALLYRDVLGEASTHVGGTASRRGNVKLAGQYLNDTILLPGEVFSYLATCGPYETEKGYGMGAAYQNGKTVLTPGGGVCQGASTLYLATLRANLETVERTPHGYEPSYIPAGLDATVAGSEIDFKFKNNTEYPVKIKAWVDGESNLHVVLHGTDTTGIHGEPYSTNRVVTKYAGTVYEPDESVPRGTTRKDSSRTAYNAVSAEAYNKLVDKDGNVVDTVYLHKDNYHARNGVILYNPADAESLGIQTAAPEQPPVSQSVEEE